MPYNDSRTALNASPSVNVQCVRRSVMHIFRIPPLFTTRETGDRITFALVATDVPAINGGGGGTRNDIHHADNSSVLGKT